MGEGFASGSFRSSIRHVLSLGHRLGVTSTGPEDRWRLLKAIGKDLSLGDWHLRWSGGQGGGYPARSRRLWSRNERWLQRHQRDAVALGGDSGIPGSLEVESLWISHRYPGHSAPES